MNQWMAEYAVTHTHPLNKKIHLVCVPAIYWSITGILPPWAFIPVLAFYLFMGLQAFIVMLVFTGFCYAIDNAILRSGVPLIHAAVIVFIVAWIGQFYGHHVEGKRPAFLHDLLFLLIGPLWVARSLKVV